MRILIAASILLISGASAPHHAPSPADQRNADLARVSATGERIRTLDDRQTVDATRRKMHVVRMVGDEKGYRFEPANLTIQQGDSVQFIVVSGGPHNVAFDSTSIPAGSREKLSANMPSQIADLMGPILLNVDESYTVSFAGLPAGAYGYSCTPHLAMNQRGTITVR